jgi:hypothetical protein
VQKQQSRGPDFAGRTEKGWSRVREKVVRGKLDELSWRSHERESCKTFHVPVVPASCLRNWRTASPERSSL